MAIVLALLASVSVVVFDGPGVSAARVPDMGACPASASDEAAAMDLARECGSRVEVLSGLSEREQRFANSDGTVTVEVSATPKRVSRGDGVFVPVDTTLSVVDGVVVPVAAVADVRLSAGGDGDLLSVAVDGRSVAWTWPEPLPAPILSGDTAVYRDVPVEDVDLHVRVEPEGASTIFVVKTREAAEDPALRGIEFGLSTQGLVARDEPDAGVSWVDEAGAVVLITGEGAAWDSSPPTAEQEDAARAAGVETDGLWEPGVGATSDVVPVSVESGVVRVSPDPGFLTDVDATLPLVIDPTVSRTNWAMINTTYPNQCYVMCGYDADDRMKVGYTDIPTGQVYRSMVSFFGTSFDGTHVLEAKLRSRLVHSWDMATDSCPGNDVTNVHSTATFSANSTYNNHYSSWSSVLASTPSQNCNDASNVYSEWGSAAFTNYVNVRANANQDVFLGLSPSGTTGTMGWKKFDENNTTLIVTYNSYPARPASPTVQSGASTTAKGCVTGAGRPFVGVRADGSVQPVLRATLSDPDVETDLRARFTWERSVDGGGTWSAGAVVTVGPQGEGATSYTIPAGANLADGHLVRWKVQTLDPWSYGGSSGTDTSLETGWCEFAVDDLIPGAADVESVDYPDDGLEHGSAGLSGDFTLRAGGVPDVAGYRWGWEDPPTAYAAAPSLGADRVVELTPPPPSPDDPTNGGLVTLYVRAVDRADNQGPVIAYAFRVGQAAGLVGKWDLTTTDGVDPVDPLTDSTADGTPHHLTASGVTTGVAGRGLSGPGRQAWTAAVFNGTSSSLKTSGTPVLDTATSFTVTAWVRLDGLAGNRVVVSQPDSVKSPFELQYQADQQKWCISRYASNIVNAAGVFACGTTPARAGVWTHLAAVFDSQGDQMRLYVNGVEDGMANATSVWASAGPLTVGASRNSFETAWFNGGIAEVRVWNRVLTRVEVEPLAATMAGQWRLNGNGSDSLYGRSLTSSVSVGWVTDPVRGGVVSFNGTDGQLAAAGPAVRTDQSFTVSAWVNLAAAPTLDHKAVTQDSGNASGFLLGVRRISGTPYWSFCMKDTPLQTSATRCAVSTVPLSGEDVGGWTHLVGVYDAARSQLRLFVNGLGFTTAREVSPGVPVPPWHAAGPFVLGREQANGLPNGWFDGDLDDVRVFAGAMTAGEVTNLCNC